MKYLYTSIFIMSISISLNAQEWTSDRSSLYYVTEQGKVYIEPDYSASAIYFNNSFTDKKANRMINKMNQMKSTAQPETLTMESMTVKGIIRLKSTSGLQVIGNNKERKEFLNFYGLTAEGAYDVLPAFKVDDIQVWFTKRVVINLKDNVGLDQIEEILSKYNAIVLRNLTNDQTFLLEVKDIENQLKLIQDLDAEGFIKWGEPDFKMEIVRLIDPNYSDQWHLNNTGGDLDGKALVADVDIDAPEAWGISTGVSNVVVAVIDDGLEAHEDMAALLPGYTPANDGDGTPFDSGDGHGQQCAGLIGAQHNEIGVRGVAPGVSMFSVNIYYPGTTNADIATGIDWAVNHGADVLTNSWGFTNCNFVSSVITSAFSNAASNGRGGLGCIILVASGNDNGCVFYPANLSTVIAVGAISGDGERSEYSNYGPELDIVAPSDDDYSYHHGQLMGVHGLRTIDRMGTAGSDSGDYSSDFGGTSGAAPQVAGVAALVLSVNPGLTKTEVDNILTSTADDVGSLGFDNEYGYGRVNAYEAVVAALGGLTCKAFVSVPTGLTASTTTATIFWDVIVGATYDLRYRETGTSTWITIAVSGTSYSLSGLTPLTQYEAQVRSNCPHNSTSAYNSTINFTTPLNYCASASTNIDDEYIGRVQLNTIDNASGGHFYTDFTNISTDLTKDTQYTITVTPTWTGIVYSEDYSVWIDYNQDGDFRDPGEQVWTQSATQTTPVSGIFTPPSSAIEGATRMRVSMKYNTIPTSCETFQYGEVEDYTVNIVPDTDPPSASCTRGITSYPYSESFETSSIGFWTQDTGDDIDWTRGSGRTPSSSTGPSGGAEGTWYMYVEASTPNFPHKQAILNSPCFDLGRQLQATFSFKYHMYGSSDMGTFVLEASDDGGSTWLPLWGQTGNQGNRWYSANVDLAAYLGGSVQLRFNRTTGRHWKADIAVDDISLSTSGRNNCAAADLTLTITFDDYPEDIGWTLNTWEGSTVKSNSYSSANPKGSTVVENIKWLVNSNYVFTITDSFGDGLCCEWGNGSYTLESSEGVIVTGATFTGSVTTNFCLDETKAQSQLKKQVLLDDRNDEFRIYPNPAKEILTIKTLGRDIDDIKIFSINGVLVKHIQDVKGTNIDVSQFASAIYFVRIISGDKTVIRKFIKE